MILRGGQNGFGSTYLTYCRGDVEARFISLPVVLLQFVRTSISRMSNEVEQNNLNVVHASVLDFSKYAYGPLIV